MIVLEVNGVRYMGFTEISVSQDFKNLSGEFSFQGTLREDGDVPIKNGDACRVYVEGESVINGYVEKLDVDYDDQSHTIRIGGRDRTCDIIDSTLQGGIEFKGGVTLEQVVRKVLDSLNMQNIKVISTAEYEPFTANDITNAAIGDKAFAFIEKYCRKRQVMATNDGSGNLLLARGSTDEINTQLIHAVNGDKSQNNIWKASLKADFTKRFNTYIVYSQCNNSADNTPNDKAFGINSPTSKNLTNRQGKAVDNEIRPSRIHAFTAETTSDFATLEERAKWEANIRRAESLVYEVKLQGYKATKDDKVWRPNFLVRVYDEFSDIDTSLLIKKVTYSLSVDQGSTTTLELVSSDAFTLEAERNRKLKRKKAHGDKFVNDSAFLKGSS